MNARWMPWIVLLGCLAAVPAWAEPVQPEGMPAKPGEYTGYEDWLAKQKFTKKDMPDAVVNDYVQCAYRAVYAVTTPTERDVLDQAARSNGMTAPELRAFERAVARRYDSGAATVTAHILKTCKAPYEHFLAAKAKAEQG
ncbi:hypothetical protein [Dongia sp.]|uniref:hypothetical protein n=1 Tax=Dongia sp. TaxID=1977262 RepID=UPI0037538FB1